MSEANTRKALLQQLFVLPADVLVFPVTELAGPVREALGCGDDQFAVTRPGFRTLSRLVDAETAALLEEFRQPCRLVEGVLRYSRRRHLDPEALLEQAFPVLHAFSGAHLLVPEDSPFAEGVEASFGAGQFVAGYTVRRLVQALEDTELYQVTDAEGAPVALKISRGTPSAETLLALRREAAVLRDLEGACSPRLAGTGTFRGRSFLATTWLAGVPIGTRARELRTTRTPGWRARLHALGASLLEAYQTLHARGIAHGDVHTGNVFADADDRVYLLDFGLARFLGRHAALDHARRAGLAWFMAPEVACPLLYGAMPLPATLADEQYAVAALLYVLLCGEHHLEAPPEREALYRAILEAPPLPFARRGFESWPETEAVLAKALAKAPEARFPSTQAFLEAFRDARPPRPATPPLAQPAPLTPLVNEVLDLAGAPQPLRTLFPEAPTASAQYGAAGLAWFLYRTAQVRGDADLLALSDLWAHRAAARLGGDDAFHAPAAGVTPERVGPLSLYHRAGGVHAVRALAALARGDLVVATEPLERYTALLAQDHADPELAFGRSGLLVGGALLAERLDATPHLDAAPLRQTLGEAADAVWSRLAEQPEIGTPGALRHLGMAHGWAGLLYAQLRARQALSRPLPRGLADRLDQLEVLAEPHGRGLAWTGTIQHAGAAGETPAYAPGWCSGSGGYVLLWTLAHALTGAHRWLRLAEQSAWHTWEHPDRHPRLCCGLAGRGFALLTCYRHTGDPAWLHRARQLAASAAGALGNRLPPGPRALSLFWGALGPALLAAELDAPERAAFPFFESEGWTGG